MIVLAGAVLLPGLDAFGLWEPQERQLSDRVGPHEDGANEVLEPFGLHSGSGGITRKKATPTPPPAPAAAPGQPDCIRQAPKDAVARTLTNRAIAWGRDLDDSDAGRRLPFALLGFLTVLATAGIAMRTAGTRAGVISALVILSMPLLVLQSRQLNSEIGTAAGGALVIYGLLALRSLEDVIRGAFVPLGFSIAPVEGRVERSLIFALIDTSVGIVSLGAGLVIGFVSGGALLGVLVPVGAFAAAGALGVPTVADAGRGIRNALVSGARRFYPRWAVGREPWPMKRIDNLPAVIATLIALVVLAALIYQIFSLRAPQPGLVPPQRELFGRAIVSGGCYSPALGAVWRADDDLRFIWDSTFEQIAYGTFPWGVLAPIAFASLMAAADRGRRVLGSVTFAWAGAAWIATEIFQRKVGFALWAGFPALAAAIGGWLDGVLARNPRTSEHDEGTGVPRGAMLIGLFVALAILDLGKDIQSFSERLTSLLVGGDAVPYPTMSHLVMIPTRLWVLIIGLYVGIGFAIAMIAWRDDLAERAPGPVARSMWASVLTGLLVVVALPLGLVVLIFVRNDGSKNLRRDVARTGALVACVGTVLMAAFWAFGWQPALADHLSSKSMFDTYEALQKPGDSLVVMGELGDAPHDYAPDARPEMVTARDQIVAALGRQNRVFAIAPQTELCQLHREVGGKPYFVIDDRNVRSLLLSNKVDGTTDKNPLATAIVHSEPKDIPHRPKGKVVFDGRVQLLGWDMPRVVGRGAKFEVKMFYKVLQPVGGTWKVLFHFDGPLRFNGDHEPINGRCQTSTWQLGDYIIDTYTVIAGGGAFSTGTYEVWTGFFTGTAPNWKNMPVSEAPGDMRDNVDRVKITTLTLD